MQIANKTTRSQLNTRYVLNKHYSLIRFFPTDNPTQTYYDIPKLIEFIIKRKIDINHVDYELQLVTITQKIKRDNHHYYFSACDDKAQVYLNTYSTAFHEFNHFLEVYYQWVNLQTGYCFIGAQFVLTQLQHCDEKIAFLAKKLLNEKTLVL